MRIDARAVGTILRLTAAWLCLGSAFISIADPVYHFSKEADRFLDLSFPRPSISVHITLSYEERAEHFAPTNFGEILSKNIAWRQLVNEAGSFRIPDDVCDSYWLSLLGVREDCGTLIQSELLSVENTSNIHDFANSAGKHH